MLRRRMLLIVTEPPHDETLRRVFDLQLDPGQLHPLRRECLRDAERQTSATREKVRMALTESGTGYGGGMLLHGLGALALGIVAPELNVLAPGYGRRIGMRRLLESERGGALRECASVTADMFSEQIDGGNPDTMTIWQREESVAYRAWQAAQRITELQRRFRSGEPLEPAKHDRTA